MNLVSKQRDITADMLKGFTIPIGNCVACY